MERPISAYKGDEPYVFVCYAHKDKAAVYPEIEWLHEQGINVWYDEGISPGLEWSEALAAAIQGCSKVIFFVTPTSVTSEHCRRELNFAQEESCHVVTVHLRLTDIPAGLRLSLNNRQAILKHELSMNQYRAALLQAAVESVVGVAQPGVIKEPRRVPLLLAGIIAGLVLLAVGAWWTTSGVATESSSIETDLTDSINPDNSNVLRKSIAVLPFTNQSPDPKDGYFAAGIHEEVLNQLSKIKDLSVIARTTMLRYSDSDKSVPEIGDELNVTTVMEGSVRYAGNRVRVTAQLIDSVSGAHLWSEAYEENLEDIFGVQLAIASQIAATLGAEFSLGERERIGRRATENPEAYGHYLRALSEWGNLAAAGPVHQTLDAAIRLDSDFGAALAFKAWIYSVEAAYGNVFLGRAFNAKDQEDRNILAERFARRTLEFDDQEARAHLTLAFISLAGRRWRLAFEGFDRAYTLAPNDFAIVNAKGWSMYWRNSDIESAIGYLDRSMELNPADAGNMWNIGEFLYLVQRWEAARSQANLVIGLLPGLALGYAQLALVSSRLGDVEAVHRNAQLAEARNPGLNEFESLARAYGQIGDLVQARRIFELTGAGDDSQIPNLGWQFWMHMAVEDYDSAIGYLKRIVAENFPYNSVLELTTTTDHPDFDPIRSYPIFDDLVRKARTPFHQAD